MPPISLSIQKHGPTSHSKFCLKKTCMLILRGTFILSSLVLKTSPYINLETLSWNWEYVTCSWDAVVCTKTTGLALVYLTNSSGLCSATHWVNGQIEDSYNINHKIEIDRNGQCSRNLQNIVDFGALACLIISIILFLVSLFNLFLD